MLKKIIKCSTSWCGPCRAFRPIFEKVSKMEKYKDIEFKECDIENDEDADMLCEKHRIMAVPATLLLDENGELITKVSGLLDENTFTDIIDERM